MSDDRTPESEYRPSGCRVVVGAFSITLGVVLLVTGFPWTILPAAVLVGGGARLIWNIGSI